MSSITSSRKADRLNQYVSANTIINDRLYNMIMGGTVLYGIVLNIIMYLMFGDMTKDINPLAFLIGYFACCFIGIIMSSKSDNPIISFIGYNLVVVPVGTILSSAIEAYGGLDSTIVFQAFIITAGITFCMIGASMIYPQFFSKLGGILLGLLIGLIITELLLMLFRIPQIITAWIGAIIFSLYIGYDFWKSQEYPKTVDNAIDSALDIYLDIINLFIKILEILGSSNNSRKRR